MAERLTTLVGQGLDARNALSVWTAEGMPCSTGMREAVALAFAADHKVVLATSRRSRLDTLAPLPLVEPVFGARHIPQRALDRWWNRHFGHAKNRDVRFERNMRCLISTSLAAAAENCALSDAAAMLEMPLEVCIRSSTSAASAMGPDGLRRFHTAINGLIRELNYDAQRIDYQRRRRFMREWTLDPDLWKTVTHGFPRFAQLTGAERENKQLMASILVWTRVTAGDYLLAPALSQLTASPLNPMKAYVRANFRNLAAAAPGSPSGQLARRLEAHADRLAVEIDATR
jgi:hypothetical protein